MSEREEHDDEAMRQAQALLSADDETVRAYYVGVTYGSGSDFSFGVNKAAREGGNAPADVIEQVASHLQVAARALGEEPERVAAAALAAAEEQEEIGGGGSA